MAPERAAARIRSLTPLQPPPDLVPGSSFLDVIVAFDLAVRIEYHDVPGFPPTGVTGHAGKVLVGRVASLHGQMRMFGAA
jgi:purine-nucleoside phosphorylase